MKSELEFLKEIHNYCEEAHSFVGRNILDGFDRIIKARIKEIEGEFKDEK